MAYPVFPTAPFPGLPVKKSPRFATVISQMKSLREVRTAQQAFPGWEFEIPFEGLRDQTQNHTPYAPRSPFSDYTQLVQLFLESVGPNDYFLYDDPTDDSRLGQFIFVGNGVTSSYTIGRYWGAYTSLRTVTAAGATLLPVVSNKGFQAGDQLTVIQTDGSYFTTTIVSFSTVPAGDRITVTPGLSVGAWRGAPVLSARALNEPVGYVNTNLTVTVYFNTGTGPVAQSPTIYSLTSNNSVLTFTSAPAAGTIITMDFSFYYLCRYTDEQQDYEEFFKDYHKATIKFHSVLERPTA